MATAGQRHVLVDIGMSTLEGFIAADADLDGTFELIEEGTGERLRVNGWLADCIEDVDQGRSCCNGVGCSECAPAQWGVA